METTTESKPTPERWKADELDEHTISIRLDSHYSHECIHIADVFVMSGNLGEEVPKAIARARLIASAPETAAERDRLKEINKELVEIVQKVAAYQKSVEAGFQGIAKDHYLELRTMIELYFAKAKGQ